MNLIFSLPWIQLFWIFMLHDCRAQVTITTQPSNVTVFTGGVAEFTCVVHTQNENVGIDDIMWKRFDNMGNVIITLTADTATNPYVITNYFITPVQLISTLKITDVKMKHAGFYQCVIANIGDRDLKSIKVFLSVQTATITTQPSDVTVCNGGVAVFTCVVDRNGPNITSDDVRWQQIRIFGVSALSTSNRGFPFNITTTISGDILTSTLTITGVTDSNVLGTSLYRCVVPASDTTSRNASLQFSKGPPETPMNIRVSNITSTSFVVQWDEVDDVDWYYIVNLRSSYSLSKATTSRTSLTTRGLTPNTTYYVTVTAINRCEQLGTISDAFMVNTSIWNAVQLSSTSTVVLQSTSSIIQQSKPSSTTVPTQSTRIKSDSSSLSTRAAVAVTFTITFIITLTVSVVITFLITFVIVKRKLEKIYKTTHQPTQQIPLYDTVITPAITKSDVKLEANPAYGTNDRVVMNDNPAYQSCK